MSHVFDASAVLALVNSEKGAAKAASLIAGSSLSAVNAVEVQQKLIDVGMSAEDAEGLLDSLGLTIMPFDARQASLASALRPFSRRHGLSLADCACISLALALDRPALSGTQAWNNIAKEVGFRFDNVRQ
ncbi:type II toxin-antitoxin system VapC family toxin [Qipengyuania spongiae]|uniref:Type II toxin-antitoxin system VapC family toxin n=1 Tax=Qipengyuania spongiae TaxID=2909673 RepID=A0ABY5T2W6_9SPHN|nr:type II toxin-antitoxin system VapC family toxin [Qipengyuania spongiae]UVI40874.1 type II toxin-antitoxin system VapC family toxin [Qipengyuania spongiae]